jgi:nucleoporin GLE1
VWYAQQFLHSSIRLRHDLQTEQICGILQPTPALPLEVYVAGLSALSKAILLQAETEVTAVQKAAIPLAGVTGRLLARLPDFSRIFWARLVQRSGAWCIPCSVPTHEPSGDAMDEKARKKAMGLKDGEAPAEYISRVSGVMRLYFEVMKISTQSPTPLEQEWRLPRAWAWATRLLGRPGMMASTAAPLCVFGACHHPCKPKISR